MKRFWTILVVLLVMLISVGFARFVAEPNDIQVAGEVTSRWVNQSGDTVLLVAMPEADPAYSPALMVRVILKNEPEYSWAEVAVGDHITVTGIGSAAISSTHDFTVTARKLRFGNLVPQ